MLIVAVLVLLGAICLLVGAVLYIVGAFRASFLWGCLVFLIPLAISIVAPFLGLYQYDWWWIANLVIQLPSLAFLFMHWDKAKNGFLLIVTGWVFCAAAFFTATTDLKQRFAAIVVGWSGKQLPPNVATLLDVKPTAAANAPGAAGATDAKPDAAAASTGKPTSDSAAAAPGGLENETQVSAAVAELNDRAVKLKARKEFLKGSPDQMAVAALAEDIKVFNERLKAVTARQVELKMIPAPPPPPTPGPAIPPTVVIPPSTPAPSPTPKKK